LLNKIWRGDHGQGQASLAADESDMFDRDAMNTTPWPLQVHPSVRLTNNGTDRARFDHQVEHRASDVLDVVAGLAGHVTRLFDAPHVTWFS
jgi:hypothetical protein